MAFCYSLASTCYGPTVKETSHNTDTDVITITLEATLNAQYRISAALVADWLIAITVLVVGILGITGVIPIPPQGACVMLGVGGTYLLCCIAQALTTIKAHLNKEKEE